MLELPAEVLACPSYASNLSPSQVDALEQMPVART